MRKRSWYNEDFKFDDRDEHDTRRRLTVPQSNLPLQKDKEHCSDTEDDEYEDDR